MPGAKIQILLLLQGSCFCGKGEDVLLSPSEVHKEVGWLCPGQDTA